MNETTPYIGGIYAKDSKKYILVAFNLETDICQFISFEGDIVGGTIIQTQEKHLCACVDIGQSDSECATCKGTGVYYLKPKSQFAQFILIARNMRSFLIQKFVD